MNKNFSEKREKISPAIQARLTEHHESLTSKLAWIGNAIETVDQSIQSISALIVDVKSIADKLSENYLTQLQPSQKNIKSQISELENKVKHCNQSVESLHVKSNSTDSQIKLILDTQQKLSEKMDVVQNMIIEKCEIDKVRNEHVDRMFDTLFENVKQNNQQEFNNDKKSEKQDTIKETDSDRSEFNRNREAWIKERHPKIKQVKQCDTLILSDSILQRIKNTKFAVNEKTFKRYVRGGAKTCTNWIEKEGQDYKPKRVLIHIGARDLQNNCVSKEDFEQLFNTARLTWPHSEIFVLPILYRKDIDDTIIDEENMKVKAAAQNSPDIFVMKEFFPTSEMFYDDVHLNDSKGIPTIVKYLSKMMDIPFVPQNSNSQLRQPPKIRDNMTARNITPSNKHQPTPTDINNNPMTSVNPPNPQNTSFQMPFFNPWLFGPWNIPPNPMNMMPMPPNPMNMMPMPPSNLNNIKR